MILIAGIAPNKYVDKHILKIKKVATLNLNLEGKVQVLGLSIAGSCRLLLIGNYGVKGNFNNHAEELYFGDVMIAGEHRYS